MLIKGEIIILKKNDILEVNITAIGINGEGIAKHDGFAIFVPFGVVGDTLKIKMLKVNKNYGYAKIIEIIKPSKNRRNPVCKSFDKCGGCQLMHMNYDAQLKVKSDFVYNNITRIGGYNPDEFLFENIIGADDEYNYRNKAQFPVGIGENGAVCGFYSQKSHDIISCETCHIQDDKINLIVNAVMEYVRENNISVYDEGTHSGIIRHIFVRCSNDTDKSAVVCIVTNTEKMLPKKEKLLKLLKEIKGITGVVQNINTSKTNVVLGSENKVLYGEEKLISQIGDNKYIISPHSFYQVNHTQVKKLYDKALEYADLSGNETVVDLYCGAGTISLYMAKYAKKVIGVEIVEDAVENARENAKLNGIDNAEFICGDCTLVTADLVEKGVKPDVVVVDPPRKGCTESSLNDIVKMNPEKIVYVSCNSATLARDLMILKDRGYILQKCTPVDLFPQTVHIECVALVSRID